MQEQRTHGDEGSDRALRRLLRDGGIDIESARLWLQDALGCLEEPLDGFSVGNASNQAAKAFVALGEPDVWHSYPQGAQQARREVLDWVLDWMAPPDPARAEIEAAFRERYA